MMKREKMNWHKEYAILIISPKILREKGWTMGKGWELPSQHTSDKHFLFYWYIKKTLNFMTPFYGEGSTVSRLQNYYEETVYF